MAKTWVLKLGGVHGPIQGIYLIASLTSRKGILVHSQWWWWIQLNTFEIGTNSSSKGKLGITSRLHFHLIWNVDYLPLKSKLRFLLEKLICRFFHYTFHSHDETLQNKLSYHLRLKNNYFWKDKFYDMCKYLFFQVHLYNCCHKWYQLWQIGQMANNEFKFSHPFDGLGIDDDSFSWVVHNFSVFGSVLLWSRCK